MRSILVIASAFFLACASGEWWDSGNFYQIYPRSFQDSDGDGIGDLQGVRSRVGYLKEIGMTGIWLTPINRSPMKDHGYDVSDFMDIDPIFGTLKDFDDLLAECRKHDIHLIVDFVPNHTSEEHEWFRRSEKRDPEYDDYYIWHPGKLLLNGTRLPPNNWNSVFENSAWRWSETRKEFFYHSFSIYQPDLNYRNPKVVEEMKEVIRFWLDRGASGIRVDAIVNLFETTDLTQDEPISGGCRNASEYCYLSHIFTIHRGETLDMVTQWRELLEEYQNPPRIMMSEAYVAFDLLTKYYIYEGKNGAHIPFNFELLTNLTRNSTGEDVRRLVENHLNYVPPGYSPNWVLSNHDRKRIATRLGVDSVDLFNVLMQTLPGHTVTYQGDELGMADVFIPWNETVDPWAISAGEANYLTYSRDPVRTPFQWNSSRNAGFSRADKTWLPVGLDYETMNVAVQNRHPRSHLSIFKNLTRLRREPAFMQGIFLSAKNVDKDIFTFIRERKNETYLVILNFGRETKTFKKHFYNIEAELRGVAKKQRVILDTDGDGYPTDQILETRMIEIRSRSAIILKAYNSASSTGLSSAVLLLATAFWTFLRGLS